MPNIIWHRTFARKFRQNNFFHQFFDFHCKFYFFSLKFIFAEDHLKLKFIIPPRDMLQFWREYPLYELDWRKTHEGKIIEINLRIWHQIFHLLSNLNFLFCIQFKSQFSTPLPAPHKQTNRRPKCKAYQHEAPHTKFIWQIECEKKILFSWELQTFWMWWNFVVCRTHFLTS